MTDYERGFRPPRGRSSPRTGGFRPTPRPTAARPPKRAAPARTRAARPTVSRVSKPPTSARPTRKTGVRRPYTQSSSARRPVRPISAAARSGAARPTRYRPATGRLPYPRRPTWPRRRRWPPRWNLYGWPRGGFIDYPPEDVYPSGAEPVDLPPALSGVSAHGQRALHRSGLLTGAWRQRLNTAPPELHRFIRQFCRTAGFTIVVRRFFGSSMQRRAAILGIRLAGRIAARIPDFRDRMVFTEDIGVAPGGMYLSLRLELDDRHYLLMPWSSLDPRTVRRQIARDKAHYEGTDNFRWVFSARRLGGMPKEAVVKRLSGILSREALSPEKEPEPVFGRARSNRNGAHNGGISHDVPDLNRLVIVL